jgi:uncharacterized protein (DUF1501 family)
MVAGEHEGLLGAVAGSTADLLDIVDRVGPALADVAAEEGLAAQLAAVEAMVAAGLPTRVYCVDLGGFDTHASQDATHAALLAELDAAVGDFLAAAADDVTVAIYSEFGRRVRPNASAGTDHGAAGTVLLAGAVRPGHHGDPPPLDRLDEGDLTTTVDFRSVLGGLVAGVLGAEPGDVLEEGGAPLELVSSRAAP